MSRSDTGPPSGTLPRLGDGLAARPSAARPPATRLSADWVPGNWGNLLETPACHTLGLSGHAAKAARRFTRATLGRWELERFADDAELIVTELVANAVLHAARAPVTAPVRLRLLRRAGEMMCAVLDASDTPPVLRLPRAVDESGRGLRLVDAIADVWGWSPLPGHGKAVWAILLCG